MKAGSQPHGNKSSNRLVITLAIVVGSLGLAASQFDWRSETQRLIDEIDRHALQRGDSTAAHNHLIPADLDQRDPSHEFIQDHSPQIDGEETTMTSYYLSSGLTVGRFSYDGHVWGYLLTTESGSVAIVDSNRDGDYDRMYRANEPIYIPNWIVAIAGGA